MNSTELLVVAVGLLAGYLLVNFFLGSRSAGTKQVPPKDSTSSSSSRSSNKQSGYRSDRGSDRSSERVWHEVLEITPQASLNEIRTAYKRLISQYHPDKVASLGIELKELANRKSQQITSAYRSALTSRGTAE